MKRVPGQRFTLHSFVRHLGGIIGAVLSHSQHATATVHVTGSESKFCHDVRFLSSLVTAHRQNLPMTGIHSGPRGLREVIDVPASVTQKTCVRESLPERLLQLSFGRFNEKARTLSQGPGFCVENRRPSISILSTDLAQKDQSPNAASNARLDGWKSTFLQN